MSAERTAYRAETVIDGIAHVLYGYDPQVRVYYLDAFDTQGHVVDSMSWENNPTRLSYLLAQFDYYGIHDPRAQRAVKQGLPF